jgi:hypothetical protein
MNVLAQALGGDQSHSPCADKEAPAVRSSINADAFAISNDAALVDDHFPQHDVSPNLNTGQND